jgi:SAM-dependent methyltransferase
VTEPAPEMQPTTEDLWDLESLANSRRLGDWMFDQFADAVHGSVVEVGAGIGTFTERILAADVGDVLLIEPDARCADTLHDRFGGDPRVRIVRERLPGAPTLAEARSRFDFALCQNVLEHVEDDAAAVAAMAAALRPRGRLGLLVPAHPRLYGSLDRAFGHHRRYDRGRLRQIVEQAGLRVRALYSFNLLGVVGWWAKSRAGADSLGEGSLAVYETLVRMWRPVEERIRPKWGLSLVVHAEKP